MTPPTIEQGASILESVRDKTDEGFLWLIEEIGPRVKGLLVRKFGPDHQDHFDDAIVEAAESLWLRGEPYDPDRGSLMSWLYTPAARICITMFRAIQVRPLVANLPGTEISQQFAAEENLAPRSEEIARLLEQMRDCISGLSPLEREVILASLAEFPGTDAELGKALNTTDNTVRVTRCRALKKLTKMMGNLHGKL